MIQSAPPLTCQEEIILKLRALFRQYGYSRCRVSTFEEYDFYAGNRSALSGEEVLIFTDGDGKLMALKPDVTMSIVKNLPDGETGLRKLCYNENIYRIPTGGTGFRETVQTGLECIGTLDAYSAGEVVMLAARSLGIICPDFILELSHIGIRDGLLEGLSQGSRAALLKALEQKNLSALRELCGKNHLSPERREALSLLCTLYGPLEETLPRLRPFIRGSAMEEAFRQLETLGGLMGLYGLRDRVHLNFSLRGGTDYYSGLLLRGSVSGAAGPVLRGGEYDTLIRRMGKKARGIGFAVYLDHLENRRKKDPSPDVLLLYGEAAAPGEVVAAVKALQDRGFRVQARSKAPEEGFSGRRMVLKDGEVTELE